MLVCVFFIAFLTSVNAWNADTENITCGEFKEFEETCFSCLPRASKEKPSKWLDVCNIYILCSQLLAFIEIFCEMNSVYLL